MGPPAVAVVTLDNKSDLLMLKLNTWISLFQVLSLLVTPMWSFMSTLITLLITCLTQTSASHIFSKSRVWFNIPDSCHPKLRLIVNDYLDMTSPELCHLDDLTLEKFKTIPGLSGMSVIKFLREHEDELISQSHALTQDEVGEYSIETHAQLESEFKQLLIWFALLLPICESSGSDCGIEIMNATVLKTICEELVIDRSTLYEGIVAMGKVIHRSASATGGVGGAWAELNGRAIYSRMSLLLRQALYLTS
jgi:hypothetical protein